MKVSSRVDKIKKRLFDKEFVTKKEWWGKDATVLTDEEIKAEPLIVRKAMAIGYVLNNMPIEIKPDELIIGIANMGMVGFGYVFPEYALPEEKEKAASMALNESSVWGHHPVRYDKLLSMGLSGLREEIMVKLSSELSSSEPDTAKVNLYRSIIMNLNDVRNFAYRYSELAMQKALQEPDPTRRQELLKISQICSKVPEKPAETFHEALQSFWLTYVAFHSIMEFIPTGRSDQYLYPYYKKDMEEGGLTSDEARELVGSWLAKFSERVQIKPDHWEDHFTYGNYSQGGNPVDTSVNITLDNSESYNYGISANHWLINMILGGLTRDGKDATNELTYLILDTWAYLEVIAPVMSVRFHKNSPQKLYESCARILRCGAGEPALYNDEAIIEGLVKLGIPLEEARDYSNDGCWEVLIPGKTDFSYVHIEVLQLLEYVFMRGYSLLRKTKEGLDCGDPVTFSNFEEFYAAFKKQLEHRIDYVIDNKLKYYGQVFNIAPSPLLSSMMDDCVEKGLDLTQGGAKYILHAPIITGLANCVDSLAAIKKLVYEEKAVEMQELLDALKSNFEGKEPLRQMLINRAPKFGNDIEYVDQLAKRVLADAAVRVKVRQEEIDWMYFPMAIGTFESYARFGNTVGASADGRLACETLSSNYSPAVGMDKSGPTAAIKSVVYPDLLPYCNGSPLDLQINSNEVTGEAGIQRIVALIKAFQELGGNIMTLTGVSEELLREAQANPEKHRSLRVRLGGLSAYFIALSKEHQEIMIQRVKHGV